MKGLENEDDVAVARVIAAAVVLHALVCNGAGDVMKDPKTAVLQSFAIADAFIGHAVKEEP